jgi:NADH:ubiquinone oxidoreductase subunit
VAGQARYLFELYTDLYEKKLGTIEWESEEIDSLGYTLRSFIKNSLKEKHQIEARLSWLAFRKEQHSCEEGGDEISTM